MKAVSFLSGFLIFTRFEFFKDIYLVKNFISNDNIIKTIEVNLFDLLLLVVRFLFSVEKVVVLTNCCVFKGGTGVLNWIC